MKLKCLLLFVLLSFANSQIKIAGTVINNKSGSPIPFVNIYEPDSKKGKVTDSNGRFSITITDKKEIELIFSHVAYENHHQIFDSTHKNIVIKLNETLIQLNDVVVNMENITLKGDVDFVMKGDDKNNVIITAGGDDELHGGDGNDVLVSGSGNDLYLVIGDIRDRPNGNIGKGI